MNANTRGYQQARKTTLGRRCDQKTLQQRFLAQPDGPHGLRPCAANEAQFFSSQSVPVTP
jgi:hypothetical protein